MVEKLDIYALERKVEKLEFQIENLTEEKKMLKDKLESFDKMEGLQAAYSCRLESKLETAIKALAQYADEDKWEKDSNISNIARQALKTINGDDDE